MTDICQILLQYYGGYFEVIFQQIILSSWSMTCKWCPLAVRFFVGEQTEIWVACCLAMLLPRLCSILFAARRDILKLETNNKGRLLADVLY
jgi:hypothetical protein